jgi:hypothetical protein
MHGAGGGRGKRKLPNSERNWHNKEIRWAREYARVELALRPVLRETSKTFTTYFASKVSKSDHERFLARLDQRVRGEIDDAIWLYVLRQFVSR